MTRYLTLIACLALAAPLAAQANCKTVTTSWTNLPIAKGTRTAGDTVWYWQRQADSAATRCVLAKATPPPDTVVTPPPPPPDTTTPPPPPPPSGAVLLRENFDPANTAMLTAFGGRLSGSHTIDATGGRTGAALRVTVSGGDAFNPVQLNWAPQGRIWMRWYFRTNGVPGGNVKGYRFHANGPGGTNIGEVYGGSPCWSFDQEGQAACVDVGMSYTSARTDCPALANSGWHSIEVEYARSGAQVEARIWCDGKAIVLPAGPASYFGGPWPDIQFSGGDRATNTPSWIRATRSGPTNIASVGLWEMISQASGSATVWVDDIVVSTARIGP